MSKASQYIIRLVVRFYWVRRLLVSAYNAVTRNPKLSIHSDCDLAITSEKVVAEVNEAGFSNPFELRPDLVASLLKDCMDAQCYPEENASLTYSIDVQTPINPNKDYIKYMFKNPLNWESVKKIVYNSTVLSIAKDYLGNEPIVQNVAIWWSFPKPASMKSNIYSFHYDIDNLKFIKLFTYLTEVDKSNGPHIIYPRTHKYKSLLQKRYRSVPDGKVSTVLGESNPTIMVGKKGTSFFEDTYSYHKGLNPIKPRLIFQVEYSLTNHKLG